MIGGVQPPCRMLALFQLGEVLKRGESSEVSFRSGECPGWRLMKLPVLKGLHGVSQLPYF